MFARFQQRHDVTFQRKLRKGKSLRFAERTEKDSLVGIAW